MDFPKIPDVIRLEDDTIFIKYLIEEIEAIVVGNFAYKSFRSLKSKNTIEMELNKIKEDFQFINAFNEALKIAKKYDITFKDNDLERARERAKLKLDKYYSKI